jgi:hypothetical protein
MKPLLQKHIEKVTSKVVYMGSIDKTVTTSSGIKQIIPVAQRYNLYSRAAGLISKSLSLRLRRLVNLIPQSFYVDEQLKLHRPYLRRHNTQLKVRLTYLIDFLDGTYRHPKEQIIFVKRERE